MSKYIIYWPYKLEKNEVTAHLETVGYSRVCIYIIQHIYNDIVIVTSLPRMIIFIAIVEHLKSH